MGLVCYYPEDIVTIETRMIELERDLEIAKSKLRGTMLCAGGGFGYSVPVEGGEIQPSVGAFIVIGKRIR